MRQQLGASLQPFSVSQGQNFKAIMAGMAGFGSWSGLPYEYNHPSIQNYTGTFTPQMFEKRKIPSAPNVYRDAAFLASCDKGQVQQWLEKRPITYSATDGTPETPPDAHVLEYILLRRRDAHIDLLLAQLARSRSVLERVYDRSGSSIRAVACSNASLFVGDKARGYFQLHEKESLYWKIITQGSMAELRALCENPELKSGMYEGLIKSWVGNNGSRVDENLRISDKRFQQVIRFLSGNVRLGIDRADSRERHYLDGYADYEYGLLFSECWKLAETIPVSQDWAYYLAILYERMKPAYKPFDNLEAVLNRWRLEGEGDFSNSKRLRTVLAKHYVPPTEEALNHEDEAIRRAFYATFDPQKDNFIDADWKTWQERDEYCEYELQANENIWKTARAREKLRRLLWKISETNSDITSVGWFDELEDRYRKEHPEWFADEDELDIEDEFDVESANRDNAERVYAANAMHGAKTFEAEASANDMLGKQVLREDLGDYGKEGLSTYGLDQETRDRLIAHMRQDVAAVFGHARSAFKTAKGAERAAQRTGRLVWVVIVLLLVLIAVSL